MHFTFSCQLLPLIFKFPAHSSRGTLLEKVSHIVHLSADNYTGVGEISLLEGLSIDRNVKFLLDHWQKNGLEWEDIQSLKYTHPAVFFGLEMAYTNWQQRRSNDYAGSKDFCKGERSIPINGLIWMNADIQHLKNQVNEKIKAGFQCLKIKISSSNFSQDLVLLRWIRQHFPHILLRLDANGSFSPEAFQAALPILSQLDIEYIEQPIAPGNWLAMREICEQNQLPIALDEELIGNLSISQALMETIRPHLLILKPSLIGGFAAAKTWITLAESFNARIRMTSALEGNIGLNAIAQFTSVWGEAEAYQGLGTGQLFENNTPTCLFYQQDQLFYKP